MKNIICTMDDVRGDFLGPPHGTTPAAVIVNKKLEFVFLGKNRCPPPLFLGPEGSKYLKGSVYGITIF